MTTAPTSPSHSDHIVKNGFNNTVGHILKHQLWSTLLAAAKNSFGQSADIDRCILHYIIIIITVFWLVALLLWVTSRCIRRVSIQIMLQIWIKFQGQKKMQIKACFNPWPLCEYEELSSRLRQFYSKKPEEGEGTTRWCN